MKYIVGAYTGVATVMYAIIINLAILYKKGGAPNKHLMYLLLGGLPVSALWPAPLFLFIYFCFTAKADDVSYSCTYDKCSDSEKAGDSV